MKASWRRLEDVFRLCLQKTSSRRLQDFLIKTNMFALALRLQDVFLGQDQYIHLGYTSSRRLQDVFKTSSRRLAKTSSRHLQDVLQRYLQDVFKTYHQVKLFLLTRLWEVFNTFLRRSFPKTVIYRGICLGNTFLRNLWLVYEICKRDKNFSSFSFSLYYTF